VVRTLAAAAAWVDEVGLALLFPKADVVLPSLWEQVAGVTEVRWPSPEMSFVWGAKDELPAHGVVCVGRHLARSASQLREATVSRNARSSVSSHRCTIASC
jgi:hypothetical protein